MPSDAVTAAWPATALQSHLNHPVDRKRIERFFKKNSGKFCFQPSSSSPSSGSCLGIISLIPSLDWVQGTKASHLDHPLLLQMPQSRISIFLAARFFTRIQKINLYFGNVLVIVTVMEFPMCTESTTFSSSSGYIRLVSLPMSVKSSS